MQIISEAISAGIMQDLAEKKPETTMPFKSKKQEKTMHAAAHNKEFAKKVGISQKAAKKMEKHSKSGGKKK